MLTEQQVQKFRQWALSQGYGEIDIAKEIARKNQEVARQTVSPKTQVSQPATVASTTTPTVTPTPVSAEGMSFGGLAKNIGQNITDIAINQPIRTAKAVAGLGFEAFRSVAANKKEIEKKQNEYLNIGKQLMREKDPTKKQQLLQSSRKMSQELDTMLQRSSGARKENPFYEDIGTPKEIATGIVKNVGRSVGLTQDETGKIVFDFNTAIRSAYEQPVTTALVAKDVFGAVKKPGISKISKPTTAIKDVSGLEKVGTKLREGIVSPKVKATPFASEEIATLSNVQRKLGLKGSAQSQLEQLPDLFRKSQAEIKKSLKKAGPPPRETLKNEFALEIDKSNYGLDDKAFKMAVREQNKIIQNLGSKSGLELYSSLEKYRNLLKSTRTKIDRGATLLPREEARLAAFNAIKSTIDTISPEVRSLNTLQNQMYNLSEGLLKSTKKKGLSVEILGTKIGLPRNISQEMQDAAGKLLQESGGLSSRVRGGVSELLGKMPRKLPEPLRARPGGGVAQLGVGALPSEKTTTISGIQAELPAPLERGGVPETESVPHPVFGTKTKQQVLADAFKKGLNSKQIDEVAGIYDKLSPPQGGVTEDVMKIANDLRKEYISETKNNNFREITNAYKKVISAPNTPAGDVSLVFAYMKLLDPGSVVREGEFATAENTAGIPEKIVNAYNKAIRGKRLSEQQRSGFTEASKSAYEDYKSSQERIDIQYSNLAKRYGVDPDLLGIGTITLD